MTTCQRVRLGMGSTEEGRTKPLALCFAPNSAWIYVSISGASSNVPYLAIYIHETFVFATFLPL